MSHVRSYIVDTDVGGDIDDTFALFCALYSRSKLLGVTTTHIAPEEKAKIASLLIQNSGKNVPVFPGVGSDRTEVKSVYQAKYPLFPAFFGFPKVETQTDKLWYPNQGNAYRKVYGKVFDEMKIAKKDSAAQFIVDTAKKFTPENKLLIIGLGPLHNLAEALRIDATIADNIELFSMGGDCPKGYNWNIAPQVTNKVLAKVKTTVIDSEFINSNKFYITQEELAAIKAKVDQANSTFGHTVLADWSNWHKGDVLQKQNTFLYDPVTLYLALNPDCIKSVVNKKVVYPCLNAEGEFMAAKFQNSSYVEKERKAEIIQVSDLLESSRVQFVSEVHSPEKIKEAIVKSIEASLLVDNIPTEELVCRPSNI